MTDTADRILLIDSATAVRAHPEAFKRGGALLDREFPAPRFRLERARFLRAQRVRFIEGVPEPAWPRPPVLDVEFQKRPWRCVNGRRPSRRCWRLQMGIRALLAHRGPMTREVAEAIIVAAWLLDDEQAHLVDFKLTEFQLLPWFTHLSPSEAAIPLVERPGAGREALNLEFGTPEFVDAARRARKFLEDIGEWPGEALLPTSGASAQPSPIGATAAGGPHAALHDQPEPPGGFMSAGQLARLFGVAPDAFRKRLERARVQKRLADDQYEEVRNPKRRKRRYLYSADAARYIAKGCKGEGAQPA